MFTYFITVIYHPIPTPFYPHCIHDFYDPDVANLRLFYFPHPPYPNPFSSSLDAPAGSRCLGVYVVLRALVRLLVAWVRWSPHEWRDLAPLEGASPLAFWICSGSWPLLQFVLLAGLVPVCPFGFVCVLCRFFACIHWRGW